MPALPTFITSSLMWLELKKALEKDIFPQSLSLMAPKQYQNDIVLAVARYILCENKNACGECLSCRSWHEELHPDLIQLGSLEKAPGIEECREGVMELSLSPVVSSRRLIVIYSAHALSLPAANSLLKIVEEPPERGAIIFMREAENFLPTLKSRCWNLSVVEEESVKQEKIPTSENEWKKWFERTSSMSAEEMDKQLLSWEAWAFEAKEFTLASHIDKLRLISESRKLSAGMMIDLILLALKEGFSFEYVFDNLW